MKLLVFAVVAALPLCAQYSAKREGAVVRLEDASHQTTLAVAPAIGNVAFELKVKGHQVLRFPYASLEEFRKTPGLNGLPFLGPWANRLDELAFYANGKRYAFDMTLGNIRAGNAIHGFLSSTPDWTVIEAKADGKSAWVTSRLEFYRQPAWMAQFPFAHSIDMTYRLTDGVLEVTTTIRNMSAEPMPVAIGFHPYFQLTDSKREDWTVGVGAKTQWLLSPEKLPTGETRPIEKLFPNAQNIALKDHDLDDVFGDLVRDPAGRATMWVKGKAQKLEVIFGPNYRAAVIYSPSPAAGPANPTPQQVRNFICFEPMAGITNALNMAHKGTYEELQLIAAGATWSESFWVRPSGF